MTATISAASTEYVQVIVSAKESGAAVNVSTATVTMGFSATSAVPTWRTASWDTDATTDPDTYRAQCLVGPDGGVETLTAGLYNVWVKVVDSPETVIRKAGQLRVV